MYSHSHSRQRGRTMRRRRTRGMNQRTYIRNLTKRLYPVCQKDSSIDQEYNTQTYADNKITYGEMEYKGIDMLYEFVKNIQPNIDTFIDIGSGRGKLCMYMASKPEIRQCLGIELVESRYKDAVHIKQKLASEYADKVGFVNSDIFNVDLTLSLSALKEQSGIFIWFSNLCFDPDVSDKIFAKLKRELPVGTVITCSQALNQESVDGFQLIYTTKIPMSWIEASHVNIYTII
jgi:tRNA G46 methylase TrmB